MAQQQFDHLVCYGLADRITFANGVWQGADIPESKRKQEDLLSCPLMWEYLDKAGTEGWELVAVLETPAARSSTVRTYFLKRSRSAIET